VVQLVQTYKISKNNHYKQFLGVFLVLAILLIIQINMVSALEIDNIKDYNPLTKTVTISNSFLKIYPLDVVATIKLDTPINNKVSVGYQRVAEFTINSNDDNYLDALKSMDFYNAKDMKSIDREFDYKYKTTENYNFYTYKEICSVSKNLTNICEQVIDETIVKQRDKWVDYTGKDIIKGEITIGIYTEVKKNDYVEWIPTLFGEKVEEWATWSGSLNIGLIAYWNFNNHLIDNVDGLYNLSITNGSLDI